MNKRYCSILIMLTLAVLSGCEPDTPPIQRTVEASAPAVAVPSPEAAPVPTAAPAEPVATAAVSSSKEMQLAEASRCFSCHAIDRKLVGPAWKDIAAKYRGQKGAEAQLIEKVTKGGSGAWGTVPMPPNVQVSQADIKTLVRYILSLK